MGQFKLVAVSTDKGTIDALTTLLEDAKAGRIVGLAYIALRPGDGYISDMVGSVTEHRLLARGICRELEDSIAK